MSLFNAVLKLCHAYFMRIPGFPVACTYIRKHVAENCQIVRIVRKSVKRIVTSIVTSIKLKQTYFKFFIKFFQIFEGIFFVSLFSYAVFCTTYLPHKKRLNSIMEKKLYHSVTQVTMEVKKGRGKGKIML